MDLRNKSTLIKLLVTLLLIYFLYNFINVSFEDISNSILHAKKQFLIAAALLMPVTILLQIIKWYQLLRDQEARVPFKSAAVSHLSGMALGIVTPARIGELGRAWFLRELPQIKVFSLTILDKFYSTLAYFSIGVFSLYMFFVPNNDFSIFQTAAVALAMTAIYTFILLALIKPQIVGYAFNKYPDFLPRKELFSKIAAVMAQVVRKKVLLVYALGSGVWSLVVFQLWLLVNAFSEVSFFIGINNASAAHFTKTLFPVTFGELGVREATVIYFFKNQGVTESAAVSAALLLLLLNVLIPSLVGVTFITRLRWGNSSNIGKGKTNDSVEVIK
ncbi:MAG: flippase-like domain-containing protein [Candidatus Marinimicrobia bacterium]|nr:flippase-like domain-containing protein [Candidatus Neomarinimicrobiota bacterium]